jgi:ankyrin repeat protein
VEDKKKWTPLIWAACKGHVEITRYLISQGAHEQYVANSGDAPKHVVQGNFLGNFFYSGTINSNIKPTPLQWACFKGHFKIVNLLLKAEMRWDDFDQFGNDCVHLAAASGNFSVFQLLMAYGVQVDRTNTRFNKFNSDNIIV